MLLTWPSALKSRAASNACSAQTQRNLCRNSYKRWNNVRVNETRYLGISVVRSVSFRCCVNYAKHGFYCTANAIFARLDVWPLKTWYFS